MNIINETISKVRELEKRLDAGLTHNSLSVIEIKKDLEKVNISPNLYNLLTSFSVVENSGLVVLQGQFNFTLNKNKTPCKTRILLKCDDYVVHSEDIEISEGKLSYRLLTTLPACTKEKKWLEVVFLPSEGDCFLSSYDCFLWGYGITVYDNKITVGNINACECGSKCAYSVVSGKLGYVYKGEQPKLLNFSVSDFIYVGTALEISPVYLLPSTLEEEVPTLYCFMVAGGGQLKYIYGDSLENASEILARKCTSVSACEVNGGKEIVVAYSIGGDVYYFSFDGETVSEHTLLYTFSEDVERVSIVKSYGSEAYLMVMLTGGKNYMFPSVAEILDSLNESRLSVHTKVGFE